MSQQEANQDRGEERERERGQWEYGELDSMGGMSSIQYSHYPTIIQYSTLAFAFKLKQTFLAENQENLEICI